MPHAAAGGRACGQQQVPTAAEAAAQPAARIMRGSWLLHEKDAHRIASAFAAVASSVAAAATAAAAAAATATTLVRTGMQARGGEGGRPRSHQPPQRTCLRRPSLGGTRILILAAFPTAADAAAAAAAAAAVAAKCAMLVASARRRLWVRRIARVDHLNAQSHARREHDWRIE